MSRGILLVCLIVIALAVVTAAVKCLWWFCEMGEWTGLGEMPWLAAFWFTLMFGSAGASSK